MAKEIPSVGDLRRKSEVTDDEIDAAVDAYLANPQAEPFRFVSEYEIDEGAVVDAYPPGAAAVADPDRKQKFKLTMVRTAILLAHPAKR